MPSTYTVNLGIEKPATGEQSGTWGDTTNVNFDILDQAINGAISITLASAGTSGSPNTLAISDGATSDGRNKWIEFVDGGDLGASAYVKLTPSDAEKIVFIRNSLSGSRSVILFQGTYDAGRDLEVPAGVDMVVKFSGGGATATTTDVFTKLRATEITTPTLTAGTADINDGTVEAVIGGTTPKAGTFTTLTANTNLTVNASTTVDGIIDDDTMATASATKLSTSESIKAYVDSQVGTVDTLAEILANGNTSGANNLIIDNGQAITTNTVNETTAGSGVTIDSVLLKDDGVNATNLEITNIKANDGTAAGSIANSTGAVTITSFISNSVDIGGGAIDDTVIGGTTPATATVTTFTSTGIDDNATSTALTIDSSQNATFAGAVTALKGTFRVDSSDTTPTGSFGTEDTLELQNETDVTGNYTSIGFTGNAGEITARIASVAGTSNGRGNLEFYISRTSDAAKVKALELGEADGSATFAGNINVTGTVDGRDIATDGTKLDGIEAGADVTDTTNVTAALVGATIAGDVTINGTLNVLTAIDLADNDILRFGTGDDCEFFCDGAHMYTDLNAGIGNWYVRDGTTTRFTFDDAGSFTATANITAYSDRKLKDNFEVIPNALAKVSALTGYTYDRIDLSGNRQSGLIAQDVQEVLPEVVINNVDPDSGEETLSVAYGNMIGLLVEAIKELKAEVEELKGGK